MQVSIWFWVGFNVLVLAALALDLGLMDRHKHAIGVKEAALRSGVWFVLAMGFALWLHGYEGPEAALTFLTGYLIEQSLSVDNIFVMVVIFSYFGVPAIHQHRVLFWGIIGALVMRGIFIILGAWLIHHFHFIVYIFGGMLVLTGIRMAMKEEKPFDGESSRLARVVRKFLPLSPRFDGAKFFTIDTGRRVATPLLLVLILIELMDLVFAFDSIPAIFAVTRDAFLVYTSNVFAILGLRSMYFMLAGVMHRFRFLRWGLAFILAFVGAKMLLSDSPIRIGILTSLMVVAGTLVVTVVASLWIPEKR